jgi:hypothetical protein
VATHKQLSQPYSGPVSEFQDALFPARTTAQLADAADDINVQDKFPGRMVFDTTLGQPVWADGAGATATWSLSTGVVSTTPS